VVVIALTGGIGSGKSLAAQFFSDLGAVVIDADDLARSAIERGSEGFDQVVAVFGDTVLRDGQIDRRVLAEKIFGDPEAKRILEEIIHPKVRQAFEESVSSLKEGEVLIYEIPLLVETGAREKFDFAITVETPDELRISRLIERGMSSRDIEARIAAQASSEQRRAQADFVIENNGSSDDLLRQVEYLWERVIPGLQSERR
jgi:dephospho-CoA kinase